MDELIQEYGEIRVELIKKLFTDNSVPTLEQGLDYWKEQSVLSKELKQYKNTRFFKEPQIDFVEKLGNYFDWNL